MRALRSIVFATLFAGVSLLMSCQIEPIPILVDGLDAPRFVRYTMRGSQSGNHAILHRSNYLGLETRFAAGSDVLIKQYSEVRIDLEVNGLPCQMFSRDYTFPSDPTGIQTFLDKHFARSKADIGLEAVTGPVANQISMGSAAVGMTKEEVILALGYPSHIESAMVPAGALDRSRILESNHWVYRVSEVMLISFWRHYQFDSTGKLLNVIQ